MFSTISSDPIVFDLNVKNIPQNNFSQKILRLRFYQSGSIEGISELGKKFILEASWINQQITEHLRTFLEHHYLSIVFWKDRTSNETGYRLIARTRGLGGGNSSSSSRSFSKKCSLTSQEKLAIAPYKKSGLTIEEQLSSAMIKRDMDAIKVFIKMGVDLDHEAACMSSRNQSYITTTLFRYACQFLTINDAQKLEKAESVLLSMVEAGADVAVLDENGNSALKEILDCYNPNVFLDVAAKMLERGATYQGYWLETLKEYIKKTTDNFENSVRTLMETDNVEELKMILEGIPSDDEKNHRLFLHWAVYASAEKCLAYLVQKGYDVNLQNEYGETPLAYFCNFFIKNDLETACAIFKILLEAGALPLCNRRGILPQIVLFKKLWNHVRYECRKQNCHEMKESYIKKSNVAGPSTGKMTLIEYWNNHGFKWLKSFTDLFFQYGHDMSPLMFYLENKEWVEYAAAEEILPCTSSASHSTTFDKIRTHKMMNIVSDTYREIRRRLVDSVMADVSRQ